MESIVKTNPTMETCPEIPQNFAVRYSGSWYEIIRSPYEPERQTYQIAWKMIKEGKKEKEAYREWFLQERESAKLLYPVIKNE